jgi:membrane protein
MNQLAKLKTYAKKLKIRLRKMRFGAGRVSLWTFFTIFYKRLSEGEIGERSSAVAYNLTLSVFPFVIFLFTLLPYFPIADVSEKLFGELRMLLHPDIYKPIYETIREIISQPREGLLSFSFLATLYACSSGMISFMTAFNGILGINDSRNFFKQRLTAVILVFSFVVLLTISMSLLIGGEIALEWLLSMAKLDLFLFWGLTFLRYLVSFLSFFLLLVILYRFAPAAATHFKHQSLGSLTATLGVILVSAIFSKYLVEFNTYNKLYGAIGTMLAFMVWIFAVSFVIILGFEIIVSLQKAKDERVIGIKEQKK